MPETIPLAVPDLRGNEREYLARCVEDNWVSSAGPFVTELEQRMAALAGKREGVAVVNGTTALQISLASAGIGEGDIVAVPDWTFAATANAVIHTGAIPVFVDITADEWCMDPASVEKAIRKHGQRLKAIVSVDVLGNIPDATPLRRLADENALFLLEDAAGAIGAERSGASAGSYGDAGTFSFNGNKTVTAGGGGMIVTDDARLAERARHLTTQARVGSEYIHDAVGFNYRMTNINAAVGLAQLERMEEMVSLKRLIAERYRTHFAPRADIAFMPEPQGAESSCWLSSIRVANPETAHDLVGWLESGNIVARTFWRSLSAQAPYAAYPSEAVPVSRELSGSVVSLPCSSHLRDEELERVLEAIDTWSGPAVRPIDG